MFGLFLLCFYGTFAGIALLNLLTMRTPAREALRSGVEKPSFCVLIPARNEEANLGRLLPTLVREGGPKVYVFDDESDDGTAAVARGAGATVIRPREPLPAGWTGKNRACHELAKAAAEDSDAEWILFLDADVYPEPDFVSGVEDLIKQVPRRIGMISGFPKLIRGSGIQPLFLAWVGWVLLTTNPYGLVTRTGKGHNRFTNGQFGCWRSSVYTQLWPNEALKGRILEDVLIGRLCAREGIGVDVVNLAGIMGVKMYETWRETLDGMSKNSYEITSSVAGSIGLALLLLFISWGWLLAGQLWPWAALLLALSGVFCAWIVRTRAYGAVLLPIAITIGAYTILRSMVWHRRGTVVWKGRTYS